MDKIFLSYTRSDLQKFELLLDALKEKGLDIWRDVDSIRGGEKWPKAIGEAIDSRDKVLLIWSKNSSQSHFVGLEWNTAIALRKTVVPLQLDDTQLPPTLSSINAIKFVNTDESLPDILSALQVDQEKVSTDRRNKVIKTLSNIDGKDERAATEKALQEYLKIFENIFDIFKSSVSPLTDNIRIKDFETIVNERTKDFVGRDFIFNKVDEIIDNPEFTSGYIVIKGEPGIGKTALISQLVKQRGYIHHFNSSTENIRSTHTFLSNICAQLVVKYGLSHDRFPDKATEDASFMRQLLAEAVEKSGDKKVIVLIDALDEADDLGLPPGVNRLYLPRILPEGIYFVVTMREKYDERLEVDNKKYVPLVDKDPDNVKDAQTYIANYIELHNEQMTKQIKQWETDGEHFKEVLLEKCDGNFQYLHYVLPAIRDGDLTKENIDKIEDLPTGLDDYYRSHWRFMRDKNKKRYKRLQKPVLCFLATAFEPISLDLLMEWMNQAKLDNKPDSEDILELIKEWREFLNLRKSEEGDKLYHIYHTSFAEFLDEEEGLREFHRMIAANAISKVPALQAMIKEIIKKKS